MTRQELIDYCLTFPAAYEDYPFDSIADAGAWTVMRHGTNKKSFALIYEWHGKLCVNLKCDPFEADFLRQMYADVTPAYHMNKTHWNTVTLGGDVPDDALRFMIEQSYGLIRPKQRKRGKTVTTKIIETNSGKIAIVNSDANPPIITNGQTALDFAVSVGYEQDCRSIAVNKAAIADDFFKLSTGLAGEIVQKFVNFGYRLAIIGDFSEYTSKPLHDFMYESNKGKYLYFVADENEAVKRLSKP